jgi:DNA/RNA endonuclease YhcR with UshA esterase domain
MIRNQLTALVVAAALLPCAPAAAHHSFGGTYNVDQQITIKGKIAQLTLRSPHSFVYVEVQDADGSLKRWTIEGASAQQFAQQGFDKDAFKVGDPVEIVGNPSRSPNSTRARLIKITRTTDGKTWGSRTGEVVN